jgi:DNA-directed RNA polymerase specialized sigma24 family protein
MSPDDNQDVLEDIRRSLDLLLRLKIQEIRGDRSQTEMIHLLGSLGCPPAEIARLIGTTSGTVRPILSRARRR